MRMPNWRATTEEWVIEKFYILKGPATQTVEFCVKCLTRAEKKQTTETAKISTMGMILLKHIHMFWSLSITEKRNQGFFLINYIDSLYL